MSIDVALLQTLEEQPVFFIFRILVLLPMFPSTVRVFLRVRGVGKEQQSGGKLLKYLFN